MILRLILIWLVTISIAGAGVGIGLIFSGLLMRFNFFKSFKNIKYNIASLNNRDTILKILLRAYGLTGLIILGYYWLEYVF